ncbi:MAG: extracellular solute-binding protein [Succinivibrio sp.]
MRLKQIIAGLSVCFVSSCCVANEIVVWEDIGKGRGIERAANDFYVQTGIKVRIEEMRHVYALERLRLDGPIGQCPDLVAIPHDQIGNAVSEGMITPIYMTDKEKSRYTEGAIEAATYNNRIYMLPKSTETIGLFYNKKMMQRPYKTLAEFYDYSVERRRIDSYGLIAKFDEFYYAYGAMAPYGAYLFKKDSQGKYDVKDIGLDSQGVANAVADMKKFYNANLFPSATEGSGGMANLVDLFTKGNISAVIAGSWDTDKFLRSGIDIGVADLPILFNGEHMKSFIGVRGYVVPQWSQNYDAAVKFAKFLSQEKYVIERYRITRDLPATQKEMNDPVIVDDPLAKGFIEQLKYGELMPSVPQVYPVWTVVSKNLYQIYKNDLHIKDTLESTVRELRRQIDQMNAQIN